MNNPGYARVKVATSFLIAALGAVAFARLVIEVPLSSQTLTACAVAAVFAIAGFWRGIIYLRAVRREQRA